MKQLRLVLPSLALVGALIGASTAWTCDKDHSAGAKSSKAAFMSASCSAKSGAATTADLQCPGMLGFGFGISTAYAASAGSKADCGASKSASSAAVTANLADHCAGAKGAATTASAEGKHGGLSSGQCSGHASTSARMANMDCDACADMNSCDLELEGAGARVQMVPLKNGAMFVYTSTSPGKVSALQTSLARRTERLSKIVSSGEKAHLCSDCKVLRGAMVSGKLNREVVNIEGGALTLMTSNDPAIVARIHSLVEGNKVAKKG